MQCAEVLGRRISPVAHSTCSQSPSAAAVAVDVVGERLAIYTGVADAAAFVVERFAIDTGVADGHADGRAAARGPPVVGERFAIDAGVAGAAAVAVVDPAAVGLEDSTVRSLRRLPEPSCSEALVEEH